MDKSTLKEQLMEIKDSDFILEKKDNIQNLASSMLANIGDSDSFFRDDLIFSALYQWVINHDYFDKESLRFMLFTLIDDDHLFYNIGNLDDDSVFTRSFSILAIALIMDKDIDMDFLSEEEFTLIKDKLIMYYKEEQDLRGFTQSNGWAHAAAHGADALGTLSENPKCSPDMILEILDAFKCMLLNGTRVFTDNEDERINLALFSILSTEKLQHDDILAWFREFTKITLLTASFESRTCFSNVKNFIRSFYFSVSHTEYKDIYAHELLAIEKSVNSFHNHVASILE